jgi:hypothetical protein
MSLLQFAEPVSAGGVGFEATTLEDVQGLRRADEIQPNLGRLRMRRALHLGAGIRRRIQMTNAYLAASAGRVRVLISVRLITHRCSESEIALHP